jgi:hypothetical protein
MFGSLYVLRSRTASFMTLCIFVSISSHLLESRNVKLAPELAFVPETCN